MENTIIRIRCEHCNKNYIFGNDNDQILGGKYYCDLCQNKYRECKICNAIFFSKRFLKYYKPDTWICDKCTKLPGTLGKSIRSVFLQQRFLTFNNDNFTCRFCGRSPLTHKGVILHCDHIIPKSKNGKDTMENLITSCADCNYGKLDVMLEAHKVSLLQNRALLKNP
jgi:hypothetical protein